MSKNKMFFYVPVIVLALLAIGLIVACTQSPKVYEIINVFEARDSKPPVLLGIKSISSDLIRIDFDEEITIYEKSFLPLAARSDGKSVFVNLSKTLKPGEKETITGRVQDRVGNTTGFSCTTWGYNELLPKTLINEFTTKGTEKSPDRTELLVLEDGNMAGMALYGGTPEDNDVVYIFDDISVFEGTFVTIWWCSQLPSNIQNSPNSINLCANTEQDLASNNGVLVLCDSPSPGAKVLDAALYSSNTQSNNGFGTKNAWDRACWVMDNGAWVGEPIYSKDSTATRSMSRNLGHKDTDAVDDWYITVTSGSTFGGENKTEAYN
ncbi:MAG: hypothetical protein HUK24_07115 [Sphaerochaetaceae bacterium]|nr:hypothetical protein [Sphaerochaetaceae bacterium]